MFMMMMMMTSRGNADADHLPAEQLHEELSATAIR